MVFRLLVLHIAVLTTSVGFAQGRGPAVEDFVGMEVEETQVAPQGTESLFNLEKDITKISEQKTPARATVSQESSEWTLTHYVTGGFVLSLPLMIWFMIMGHLKRKASVESASNIEVLENYRRAREKKSEENIKKAS